MTRLLPEFLRRVERARSDSVLIAPATEIAEPIVLSRPGITLRLPGGCTLLGGIVVLADDVTIRGVGARSRILRPDRSPLTWLVMLGRSARCRITGVAFDGNEANQDESAGYMACIRSLPGASDIDISHCWFRHGGHRAVDLRGTHGVRITHSTFADCGLKLPNGACGNAISVDRDGSEDFSYDVVIEGNIIRRTGDTAIGCPHCRRATIAGNVIAGLGAFGLPPTDKECGISVNGSLLATVVANVIDRVGVHGITATDKRAGSACYPVGGVTIAGNTLYGSLGLDGRINIRQEFLPGDVGRLGGPESDPVSGGISVTGNTLTDGPCITLDGDFLRSVSVGNNTIHCDGPLRPNVFGILVARAVDGYTIGPNVVTGSAWQRAIEIQSTVKRHGVVVGNVVSSGGPYPLNVQPNPEPLWRGLNCSNG